MSEFKIFASLYTEQYKKLNIYKKYGFCGDSEIVEDWIDTSEKEKEVNEAIQKAIETNKPFEDFAPQWYKNDIKEYEQLLAEGVRF